MESIAWKAEFHSGWVWGEDDIDTDNQVLEVRWMTCQFTDNLTTFIDHQLSLVKYVCTLGPVGSLVTGGKTTNKIRHDYIQIFYKNHLGEEMVMITDFDSQGAHWRGGTYKYGTLKDERYDLSSLNITIKDLYHIYSSKMNWKYWPLTTNCGTYAKAFFWEFLEMYAQKIGKNSYKEKVKTNVKRAFEPMKNSLTPKKIRFYSVVLIGSITNFYRSVTQNHYSI